MQASDMCSINIMFVRMYTKHLKHALFKGVLNNIIEMLGLSETMSAGTTKTYSCVACSATFQSLASLLVHQASHANEISHQPMPVLPTCGNCGSLFASTDLLEKHHCMVVPPPAFQEMYICECGEGLDDLSCLDEHRKSHKADAQVSSNLESNPEPLSSEMEPDSKTDSSHLASGHISPNLSPNPSNEETVVKNALSEAEVVSTADVTLSVDKNASIEEDQNVSNPQESSLSHPVMEEPVIEKNCATLESSATSKNYDHDYEKPPDSCEDSDPYNKKSILKILASAYMSHRQPAPVQRTRNLPPRKVSPRAPMLDETPIAVLKPELLENQSKAKSPEKVPCSPSTPSYVKPGMLLSKKKKKIISVTQTLYPVVALETRQKLFGKDNVEGRHKCGICRRVFKDKDSLIMHHAQHKKERVKYCLRCQKFVICAAENHICPARFAINRQHLPIARNRTQTSNVPTATQPLKRFHCSKCKRSYVWKRNLKRHNCRPEVISSATVDKQDEIKLHSLKNDCNRGVQNSENPMQTHHVGVGTESIKTEEQRTEFSIEGKNLTALKMPSSSLKPKAQIHSPKSFDSINSKPIESTKTKKVELPANKVGMEEEKDTFGEKQWTMPLDDAEIDVLVDADQEDPDNEDSSEDMVKEDRDEVEDEDVVIVESRNEKKMGSVLLSNGFQVHVSGDGVKRFVCAGCKRSYSRRFSLMQHIRICGASKLKQQNSFQKKSSGRPAPEKKFPCPQCGRFFSRKDNMNTHRQICKVKSPNPPADPRIVESKPQAAQENLFVLSPTTETPAVRQESSRSSSSNWGIMSLPSVLPRRVTCECGASFTCPRLLFEHLQHHAQESYICPHCGENLQSWMDFEAHQQMHKQSQSQASEQPQPRPQSFNQVTQSHVPPKQPHPQSFNQVTQSHVPTKQPHAHLFNQVKQSHAPTKQPHPHSFNQVTQSHAATKQPHPHSFNQVTQSHVPTTQQPRSFSQVQRSHAPTGLSTGFQASQPSAPQNLNHGSYPQKQTCPKCRKTFAGRRSLLRHQRLSCRGDTAGQGKQSVHNQSNTSNPLRCPVCVRWFSCLDGLKRHLVSHSRQPVAMLSCQICDHNCPSAQALEEHKRNVHKINQNQILPEKEKQEQLGQTSAQSRPPTDFQCHICLRYYPKIQSLKDHVRKVHRIKVTKPTDLTITDPSRSGSITDPSRSGPFQCQICMRTYHTIKSLKNHRRRVHHIVGGVFQSAKGTEPNFTHGNFQCQICSSSFPDMNSLQNHKRRVHRLFGGLELVKGIAQQSQPNLYKCQICQRGYPDSVSLKNHRRRVHHILGPVPQTTTTMTTNDTIKADTIKADTIKADTIKADTIKAETIETETIEQKHSDTLLQFKPYL
ncbi:uncharacterized protein [Misgurnus anguillicaudatus]|uniref:uncharacterized protein isoform X2 n=1 Tax=Misgurnus anguillicaudatus TaxID=75329 RepID=UPI003CCF4AF0